MLDLVRRGSRDELFQSLRAAGHGAEVEPSDMPSFRDG